MTGNLFKVVNMELTDEETKLSEKFRKEFKGKQLKKIIHRVKGKNLVKFAKLMGNNNPKYIGVETADGETDYSNVEAHPCYANCFCVGDNGAAFDVTGWRFPPEEGQEEGYKLIRNFGKLLHPAEEYDYSKAEEKIQDGQKLYVAGFMEDLYIKAGKLWMIVHLDAKTSEGKLVCQAKVSTCVREGGF
jgi:hypothetical protein